MGHQKWDCSQQLARGHWGFLVQAYFFLNVFVWGHLSFVFTHNSVWSNERVGAQLECTEPSFLKSLTFSISENFHVERKAQWFCSFLLPQMSWHLQVGGTWPFAVGSLNEGTLQPAWWGRVACLLWEDLKIHRSKTHQVSRLCHWPLALYFPLGFATFSLPSSHPYQYSDSMKYNSSKHSLSIIGIMEI